MAFPLGMVGVILGYVLLDGLGIGLQYAWNAGLQLTVAVILGTVAWWRRRRSAEEFTMAVNGGWRELAPWAQWLVAGLLGWMILRWLGIVVEVMHRPLFPWDAWYAYGAQAKVWFFAEKLGVFANGSAWFASDEPAWSVGGVRHPPGIGLIQLWMVQSLGRWDDALMNLPWPLVFAGLGVAFVGLARIAGVSLLVSVVCLWLVMSLPVLDIQAVLAGYGDLWIAVYLFLATCGLMLLRREGDKGLIAVIAAAVAGLLLIKEVGAFWLCPVVLGLLAGWLTIFRLLLTGVVVVAIGVAGLWWLGEPVKIGILGEFGFADGVPVFPGYVPMWGALATHLFVLPNWHLFWCLVALSLPAVWIACRRNHSLRVPVFTGLGGVIALFGIYAFSDLGHSVIDGTSVNRLLLHPVPVLGLMLALVAENWRQRHFP
ncbi:hypothetical protein [Wenzhouxiangella sp. EGI_FJ10305]|uniref:hypothetical protein n=1 Tax=Wenzhouxiangella sp. EGI_FJ10305 TaxID=3243768 RepID=UPI0035E23127